MVFAPSSSPCVTSPVSNLDHPNSVVSARTVAASDSMSPPLGQEPSVSLVFEFRILFPSTRVNFPSVMDQQTLTSSIAALYDRLDAQTAVVNSYRSLEEALQEQIAYNDRLECELRYFQDLAPPLSEFTCDDMSAYRRVMTMRSNGLANLRRSWVNMQTSREKLQVLSLLSRRTQPLIAARATPT